MSYDLQFDCGPIVGHGISGGTHAVGGTTEPWLNITYNYGSFFRQHWPDKGIRALYGKTAEQVVAELDRVIRRMKGMPSADYWEATEGNARAALVNLRRLALLCPPDAVLEGD